MPMDTLFSHPARTKNLMGSLFPVALLLLKNEGQALSQNDWETVSQSNDMTVEKRNLSSESLVEVRVRGTIDAPIASVMNVLNDQAHYPDWMENSKEPKLIGTLPDDPGGRIFYNRGSPSFFLQDRDYYVVIRVQCAKLQKQIRLDFTTDRSLTFPKENNVVRLTDLHGHWYFYPLEAEGKTHAEYQIYADVGGSLISALKNYAVKKMGMQGFVNFRKQVYKTNRRDTRQLKIDFPQLFPACLLEST